MKHFLAMRIAVWSVAGRFPLVEARIRRKEHLGG
jgi:hypothetical protein